MKKGIEFVISKYEIDYDTNTLYFSYQTILEGGDKLEFTEALQFPHPLNRDIMERADVQSAIESLHILLGISYFRLHVASHISLSYDLTHEQADFWDTMYTKGLGEFFYLNKLDFRDLIHFPAHSPNKQPLSSQYQSDKALVLLGGGKDSLLSVEITRKSGIHFDLFSLHTSPIQALSAGAVGKEIHMIKRTMDPLMLSLLESKDAYVGHIPITAMYSFVAVLYSLINSYAFVVVSNEASANYGSVEYLGMTINHQWSKSFEAEKLMQDYIQTYISTDVHYFSLLRPLHEIQIVKLFAQFKKYYTKFSSSNHNFTQTEGKQSRWDITYSRGKVEFVFALFTAFLSKEDILTIFDDDFYAHPECLERYMELLGKTGIKPLDCVGTPEETAVAMYMAYTGGEYKDEPIMKYFENEVLPELDIEKLKNNVFEYGDDSRIPAQFKDALKEMCDTQ
ncbi:hypothetical protein KBC70_00095 [Candidatus Woesebacteria bacterium]|nr:hypothetical protein [Candidatus Woesebacteria bacterium]